MSGQPFSRPANAAVAANGDIYVSDGHGNDRVHCFSPDGELRFSWGGSGTGPGEFNIVHSVFIDHADGDTIRDGPLQQPDPVLHAAREYIGEWGGLRLPQSVRKGPNGEWVVAEHRITVLDSEGSVRSQWGDGVDADDAPIGAGSTRSRMRRPDR